MRKFTEPMVPDTFYHIYNRACGQEVLFRENKNYFFFLNLFEDRMLEYVELYSYCLIPNHFHLLVKTKPGLNESDHKSNISKKFSNFFAAYAQSFNAVYRRNGNLFSQNFRRKPIESFDYLKTVVVYIHRNPIKHGIVESLGEWIYSSYIEYLTATPRYCHRGLVIEWFNSLEMFRFCHTLDSESEIE